MVPTCFLAKVNSRSLFEATFHNHLHSRTKVHPCLGKILKQFLNIEQAPWHKAQNISSKIVGQTESVSAKVAKILKTKNWGQHVLRWRYMAPNVIREGAIAPQNGEKCQRHLSHASLAYCISWESKREQNLTIWNIENLRANIPTISWVGILGQN